MRTEEGAVKCWGNNYKGQLGDGTQTMRTAPVALPALSSGVVKIVAGHSFTCALSTDKELKCWGLNTFGMLGDGKQTDRNVPQPIAAGSPVRDYALGTQHGCLIRENQSAECWGSPLCQRSCPVC